MAGLLIAASFLCFFAHGGVSELSEESGLTPTGLSEARGESGGISMGAWKVGDASIAAKSREKHVAELASMLEGEKREVGRPWRLKDGSDDMEVRDLFMAWFPLIMRPGS